MKLYTVKEVVDILKVDGETIRRFIRNGELTAYKIGREWRIEEQILMEFVKRGENNG